jgi:alkylation response protein AidB-like acyl-CoA dehydrogenase
MDFALGDDEALFQQSVREFAAAVVAPTASAADRAGAFPTDVLRATADLGLFGMLVPEACGGAGVDTVRYVLALAEIARASAALAAMLHTHNALVCAPLSASAHPQAHDWLVRLAQGELLGAAAWPKIAADAGSAPHLTARRDGDGWVLNGRVSWVTNAGGECLYLVWDGVEGVAGPGGAAAASAFALPADTPGLAASPPFDKLGLRAAPTADLTVLNCQVPTAARLTAPDDGSSAPRVLDLARLGGAALALGIAQAALDAALAYAQERQQFGQPIARFEGLRAMLADVYLTVESARLLTYRAAWRRDRGQPFGTAATLAHLHAAEAAMLAATKAVQVHGGYGYMEESAVQRYFRDAKTLQAAEDAPHALRAAVADYLLPLTPASV